MESITLAYNDLATGGTSDKIYIVRIVKAGNLYVVNIEYGRRGGTMNGGTKTAFAVSLEEATDVFHRVVAEKMRAGYQPSKSLDEWPAPIQLVAAKNATRTPYPIEDLEEIATELEADAFLHSPKFWLQKKENGEFCQVEKRKSGSYVRYNKLGGAVPSLPAEIIRDLNQLKATSFFLEGELIGNCFITYNLLELNGTELTKRIYSDRHRALEGLIPAGLRFVTIVTTWKTKAQKMEGRKELQKIRAEGEVYKRTSAPYKGGSPKQHYKHKYTKTLSAVVIGKGHKGHNSATLGLLSDEWHEGGAEYVEVGRCSLNGKEEVSIGQVVEIRYLYGTAGNRLYQPRMTRVRTDVDPKQCTIKQIIYREGVSAA